VFSVQYLRHNISFSHTTHAGGQSPWGYAAFVDCLKALRAVATSEICFCRLMARMMAFSHLISVWRFKTARVEKRAVATNEICFCRLEARMKAFSHFCSGWRSMTARVSLRAVTINEISFNRLKARMLAFSHLSS
jgi:hypothetical protein